MNCSSCGTRLTARQRNCPACGRNIASKTPSGVGSGDSSLGSGVHPLSPSSSKAPESGDGLPDANLAGGARKKKPRRKKKATKSTRSSAELSLDEAVLPEPKAAGVPAALSKEKIRNVVHERPDRLEAGLSIYTDGRGGASGVDFETKVGLIDLLARDDAGGLVAVIVGDDGEPSGKILVSSALERVGWVRKHVAEPQQEVRAIVLLEQVPDDTSYAAAAVASTVTFKSCRLEVSFSDIEM